MRTSLKILEAYNRLGDCKEKSEFEEADVAASVAYGNYERLSRAADEKAERMVRRYLRQSNRER